MSLAQILAAFAAHEARDGSAGPVPTDEDYDRMREIVDGWQTRS